MIHVFSPRLFVGLVSGISVCPEQFFRMQELVFGHPFASCGFLACGQVVESPSLEIIKTHLDAIQCDVL